MSARAIAAGMAVAVALVGAAAARAAAADLEASELGDGSVVVQETGAGALAFDPAFVSFTPMRLVIELAPGEGLEPIGWNALVDNLTGALWGAFSIEIEDGELALIGSATGNAGTVAGVDDHGSAALVRFARPGEAAGLDLGSAAGLGVDWMIGFGAVPPPSFAIVLTPVPAPEAGASALAVAGALAALSRWRRRAPRAAPSRAR